MNIAAYCRVSTDKHDQLNSLEAQKQFFIEYTKKTGNTLVRIYSDEGISGTKLKNRSGFLQMMNDAKNGIFNIVVVKDISRFARNTVDLLQNIRKLKALGITVNFLTSNMTNLGDSEFMLTLFGAMAQEESANTSKRVKFGKRLNAQKGKVPNLVYGYDKPKEDYFNLYINQTEASIVKKIFNWYINCGYGTLKIANMLNSKGVFTKRNCRWTQNAVRRILSNELYTGKIINGKQEITDFLTGTRTKKPKESWIIVDNPQLKIIEPQDFLKAQTIINARAKDFKAKNTHQSNKHIFSTVIKCQECGRSFNKSVRTYKNTYIKWGCTYKAANGQSCQNKIKIDEEELITQLKNYFSLFLKNKKQITKKIIQNIEKTVGEQNGLNFIQELNKNIAHLEGIRQKYINMYTNDLITIQELNEKLADIKLKTQQYKNKLNTIKNTEYYNSFKNVNNLLEFSQLSNQHIKKIIQKIEVDKNGRVDIFLQKAEY